MLKINRYALALGALFILLPALGGCFQDEDNTYQGPLQVEFKPLARTVNNGSGLQVINVQLIGPHQAQPLNVRAVRAPESTAVEGVHYDLIDGGQFQIPAQSSFGEVRVNVRSASTGGVLILELQDGANGEFIAAQNLKRFTLTIRNP